MYISQLIFKYGMIAYVQGRDYILRKSGGAIFVPGSIHSIPA